MPETYYDVLRIKPSATIAQIHDAYRSLARRYHPDVDKSPDANQRMARINLAYETLSDAERRSRYDLEIQIERPPIEPTLRPARTRQSRPDADEDRPTRVRRSTFSLNRYDLAMIVTVLLVAVVLFVGLGKTPGDSIESVRGIRGGYDPLQRAIEQCYITHARAAQGDAQEKLLLSDCLLAAHGSPTMTPLPQSPSPSPT